MWGRRIGGVISGSAGAIILVTLGSLTWHQTTIWRDSETLWTRAVALYPDSGVARNYLGVTLLSKGEDQEAAHHFRWALRATDIPVSVYNNLGVVLASQGKIAKASALFAYALKLNPEDSQAELNLERARARRRVDVPNGERARPIPAEEGPEVRP
jgi:Flp pilus assembly protein TadD